MSTVYQHQLHAHKTHRSHVLRWTVIVLLILGGGIAYGLHSLKPNTTTTKAATVTKKLEANTATQTFFKGAFSIALPKGWQFMSKQQDIYTVYHFKSALPGEDGNRSIDIYEDSSLPTFPVNRMLPVTADEEGHLTTDASLVSDNCTAYTTGATTNLQKIGQMAKWQGIEFMCDMGNTLRNVVGTGSKDGINTVTVKTATSTPHHYFFTYTDNNFKPDYSIYAAAINSFKVIE
ncbi:hypothetical protein BH09PAT3_BH09PAT3_1880 [soil metagenome]